MSGLVYFVLGIMTCGIAVLVITVLNADKKDRLVNAAIKTSHNEMRGKDTHD